MLYLLSYYQDVCGPLRLFEYVTFRAGAAGATAFLLTLLFGPWTARMLRRMNAQAADRYAGLMDAQWIDRKKNQTPCMGGILLIGSAVIASLLFLQLDRSIGLILTGGTLSFALVGFLDDYRKVAYKNRDGIPGKVKMLALSLIAAVVVWGFDQLPETSDLMRDLMVPFFKNPVFTGVWVLFFAVFVIVGTSNAVNLTDGKDGLASGCTVLCMLAYAFFGYVMGHKIFAAYLNISFIPNVSEMVVFASAIAGSCLGFLWHNCYPASMFMGDTGSLALGGAVGMCAVLVRQELLLVLVGWVFFMEALSVMIQVASFKTTGKRVFLCTPIHHHFERRGWTETQIVVRFWIISAVCALLALATLKLR